MNKMTFTSPRATFEELLEFCNAIREAGGGNPLDALMPAVPSDLTQCLIARNLNFNCSVGNWTFRGNSRWVMVVADRQVRDRIAAQLELAKVNLNDDLDDWEQEPVYDDQKTLYGVLLPKEIGRVASDFDSWVNVVSSYRGGFRSERAKQHIEAFAPYVDVAIREVQALGHINSQGKLVL